MIIGVSGKKQSGKDLIGKIIQYLTTTLRHSYHFEDFINPNVNYNYSDSSFPNHGSNWQVHKFADAVKDIVCILTGCTRDQLEDIDFKNSKLPDEWIRYGYADGHIKSYIDGKESTTMNNKQCSKEVYEYEKNVNWQTAYKSHLTYRKLLQYIGTNLLRDKLNENTWINALMSRYKSIQYTTFDPNARIYGIPTEEDEVKYGIIKTEYPNWIITDVRFPNEVKAIEDRDGFIIRVNRDTWKPEPGENIEIKVFSNWSNVIYTHTDESENHYGVSTDGYKYKSSLIRKKDQHPSETALDNHTFKYTIDNNGTIKELIEKVKEILIKEKLI